MNLLEINDLAKLKPAFEGLSECSKGIEEIETILSYIGDEVPELTFEINLARGLNYYTGCIFEVKVDSASYPGFTMGSIGGGGRYDNLTGVFGLNGVSGVGVSFGAERIYDVMEELKLFPTDVQKDIEILFIALDEDSHKFAFKQISKLRQSGIPCDLYPEPAMLQEAQRQLDAAQAEARRAQSHGELLRVTAPVEGTVHQLAAHTVGGIVPAAQPLMQIVPSLADVELEAMVENRDIGFPREGQQAQEQVRSVAREHPGESRRRLMRLRDRIAVRSLRHDPAFSFRLPRHRLVARVRCPRQAAAARCGGGGHHGPQRRPALRGAQSRGAGAAHTIKK